MRITLFERSDWSTLTDRLVRTARSDQKSYLLTKVTTKIANFYKIFRSEYFCWCALRYQWVILEKLGWVRCNRSSVSAVWSQILPSNFLGVCVWKWNKLATKRLFWQRKPKVKSKIRLRISRYNHICLSRNEKTFSFLFVVICNM